MSTPLQHISIRASAGTGKTYQLANRYIALLLLQGLGGGKIAPEKIVAMTFTRKGAGEFAERILHRLAAAAGNTAERNKLQTDLTALINGDAACGIPGLAPGVKINVDAATLQSALAEMIDQFDRLVLGTIDGFMARSVQTMAFELGLGGFEILEEAAITREREELLGEVFRGVPLKDLASFYQTLKRATLKSSNSLRQELDSFVQGYHKLLNTLPEAAGWGGSVFWNEVAPIPPNNNWQKTASDLLGVIEKTDLSSSDVVKGITKSLEWLMARNPGSGAGKVPTWLAHEGKLVQIWPACPEVWECYPRSNSKTPCIVPSSIMTPLKLILQSWLADECAALSQKTIAIHAIVSRYEQLYDTLARRNGRLTFDDLPLLLDEQQNTEAGSDILTLLAFRWYQQFDHWLLDEFQDTSRVQWGVLKPWLDEAIQDGSGTKSVFVVGDPKQSIYGWRGGEPRLFSELVHTYPRTVKEQFMDESWRSRPAVLELVNRICTPDSNPALRDTNQFAEAAIHQWIFKQHGSEKAERQAQPGYAAVLLADKAEEAADETDGAEDETGGDLADKLAAQAQVIKGVLERVQPLERGLTCAILVRKNENAQAVAQWLRKHGIRQVMVEGVATLAEQSPLVAAVVDALRWLATPANTLAAGHISVTPLWDVLKQPVKSVAAADVAAGSVWRYWRRRIADIGAPLVTNEWCAALAALHPEPYAQYCLRHVSQSAQQAGTAWALPEWLNVLEQLSVHETASAGSIHVMTIHKAKGLGFDVVFLPDLDLGSGRPDEILIRRDEQGCAKGCLAYPPKWLQAWKSTLGKFGAAQKAQQDLEGLCVLYVALTRAREATFVILNKEKPRKSSPARGWILSTLPVAPVAENPWGVGELQWECGSRDFADLKKADQTAAAANAAPTQLVAPVPRRQRRKPSDAGHESFINVTASVGSGKGPEFGIAVHKVFEQIEWWTPKQSLVGDAVAVTLVRQCLEVPALQTLFTRTVRNDEALREVPVEFMEKNIWLSGIIDRLVLRRDASGQICKLMLIDFKTDHVETAAILRERYSEQLAIYRHAIAAAFKVSNDKVETVILSTQLKTIVPV